MNANMTTYLSRKSTFKLTLFYETRIKPPQKAHHSTAVNIFNICSFTHSLQIMQYLLQLTLDQDHLHNSSKNLPSYFLCRERKYSTLPQMVTEYLLLA